MHDPLAEPGEVGDVVDPAAHRLRRLTQLDAHAHDVVAPSCLLVQTRGRAAQERQHATVHRGPSRGSVAADRP